ncbi:MAG: putative outer membrane protein [Gammaproteobacteria bacterium]|nr:putative outer membrane protein [Gammaproteobacteria bacterium]
MPASILKLSVGLAGAIALLAFAAPPPVRAEDKPLWEFGLGVGALAFRDYRGADTSHLYPVAVPYFIYRGRVLQADKEGIKGKLFNQPRLEFNVSVNATTPVHNNAARDGMPDLRPTIEIGPSLNVHVWRSANERVRFDVRMPVRAAFTVQAAPRSIGWFFTPNVNMDVRDVAGLPGWNLGLLTGPLFATSRFNEYYYTVAPQYATTDRPAYRASAGYAGAQVLASLSKRFPSYWVGAYGRYDSLSGATFEDSPLVKSRGYWSAGIGIAWMISHSSRLVPVPD